MKIATKQTKLAYKTFIESFDYVARKNKYIVNGFVVDQEGLNQLRRQYQDKLRNYVNKHFNYLQINQTIKKYINEYEDFFKEVNNGRL